MGNTACATSERIFYFTHHDNTVKWDIDPGDMIDGDPDDYASTTDSSDVQLLHENNCTGAESGTITGVFIRAKAYYTDAEHEVGLQPMFGELEGDFHYFYPDEDEGDYSVWFDVTDDANSHSYWTWREVDELDVNVVVGLGGPEFTVYVSIVEIKVVYS